MDINIIKIPVDIPIHELTIGSLRRKIIASYGIDEARLFTKECMSCDNEKELYEVFDKYTTHVDKI